VKKPFLASDGSTTSLPSSPTFAVCAWKNCFFLSKTNEPGFSFS